MPAVQNVLDRVHSVVEKAGLHCSVSGVVQDGSNDFTFDVVGSLEDVEKLIESLNADSTLYGANFSRNPINEDSTNDFEVEVQASYSTVPDFDDHER